MRSKSRLDKSCCCSVAVTALLCLASNVQGQLVISAITGNGGGSAAAPNGDFVEIFNNSCSTVNLDAYSVQVASSTGTTWSVVNLPPFNLLPGQYYAIRLQTTTTGINYTADFTNPTAITIMTATSGKGAIVLGNTALTGACPAAGPPIIDFVRYQIDATGTVSCTEGLVADATGITAASGGGEQRVNSCVDTNVNRSDFVVVAGLLPRNSTNALEVCAPPISPNYGACSSLPPDDGCLALTEAQCDTAGGIYAGDCTNCPLPGACCQPNGTCAILQQADCLALGLGAVFAGDVSCPPAVACAEAGACCTPDGTCSQLIQVACLAPNFWTAGACPTVNYEVPSTTCPPNFVDISATGTELLGWATFDDSALPITLPFAFNFYGNLHTAASVGINGYVVLGGASAAGIPANSPLGGAQVNNGIYVYGDDLHLRGTVPDPVGSIHTQQLGTSPDSVFIIQWTNVDIFSPTQPDGQRNTFQVKLYEASGVIEMQYLSLNLTGQSPLPADVVIGVKQSPANFTEVSQTVVGVGPAAIIFAPNGLCNSALLPTGSCCIPSQACSELSQAACQLACGAYLGDGTNCTTTPCVTEACCLPQGGCVDALVAVCTLSGGTPQGPATNCGTANCPPAGRCCTAAGACSVTLQANCQDAGSTWVNGETCVTQPCVVGACCASDGSCSQLTEAGCTNANGIRWTAATPCTPNLCQGRCCALDGTCSITAFNACVAPNTYGGDGSTCTGTPCQGSCCNSVTGDCTLTGPAGCVGANEVFGGLGSTCAAANCSGRCCQSNGSCSVTGSAGCAGGTYSAGLDCTSVIVNTFDNIGLIIPDSPAAAVTNIQVLAGLPTPITDVDVDFFITHTFFADLVISVEHNGTIVALTDGTAACFGDNPDVVVDDEGTGGSLDALACPSGIVPPSPPNYTPIAPLSAFDGMDPNGPWTISIRDDAGLDTGTLVRWSLHISTNAPVCPVVACTCFGDMNGDATVNGGDVNLFAQCVASGGAGCPCGDMNHVGGVTADDVPLFVAALLSGNCGAP